MSLQRLRYVSPGEDPRTIMFTRGFEDACKSIGIHEVVPVSMKEPVAANDGVALFCGNNLQDEQFTIGVVGLHRALSRGYEGPAVAVAMHPATASDVQQWLEQQFPQRPPAFLDVSHASFVQYHQELLTKLGVTQPEVALPEDEPDNVVSYISCQLRDLVTQALEDENAPNPFVTPRTEHGFSTVRESTISQLTSCRRLLRNDRRLVQAPYAIASDKKNKLYGQAVRKLIYYADRRYRTFLGNLTNEARGAGMSWREILEVLCDPGSEVAAKAELQRRLIEELHVPDEWIQKYDSLLRENPHIEQLNTGAMICIDLDLDLYTIADNAKRALEDLRAKGGAQRPDRVFCRRIGVEDRLGLPAVFRWRD